MTLFDALYNWLQLKIVSEARPDDEAAKISFEHVGDILGEHQVKVTDVKKDEMKYYITYEHEGAEKEHQVPVETAEILLQFIEQNPERYEFK